MKEIDPGVAAVNAYIADFSEEVQRRLSELRRIIREEVPEAGEKISYGMPTFTLHGNLVHFGGFKGHIGFYPTPSGIDAFAKELAVYKNAKGSVQFPFDQPLPEELIRRMVRLRVEESLAAAELKKNKKGKPKA
ncbi:iron chaperone [Saccharibacillus sacchari]|uniref:iron chaperone n=1 Tax=Saccharibacillus sacchari TaxID=456493 RepID=UPI000567EB2F|nr:DUF1801 domain-containing protein [Saccharibacillus sacchari]